MASRLHHLLDHYRLLRRRREPVVMATIIETQGSTYQKAGARVLITARGDEHGLLSGGCFESDLREQALPVLIDGRPRQLFYDMRSPDDAVWGLGLGCNGAVRILLQRLDAETGYYPLNRIADTVDNDHSRVLATACESPLDAFPNGYSVFIDPESTQHPYTENAELNGRLFLQARRIWLERKSGLGELRVDGHGLKVFYDVIQPPPAILVIGAGPDAVPVTRLAAELGWRVTLVDYRPGYLKTERFPQAIDILDCRPEDLHSAFDTARFSALVLMTHNVNYDEQYLKAAADTAIPYIGLLGPAARRDRLMQSLGGVSVRVSGRVYGPVGLDIGAETPEEIALSIIAEIQAVMKQRDGSSLSSKDLPIQLRAQAN